MKLIWEGSCDVTDHFVQFFYNVFINGLVFSGKQKYIFMQTSHD